MRVKGHSDFSLSETGKYNDRNIQTRWVYFQMGWEMHEATV